MPVPPSSAARPAAPPADASWLAKLGPGIVTGAADDDPSGIATYTQAGTQFGYGMFWSLFLTYPLMAGIQTISARIGRVSGHGLASNIRKHYPPAVLYAVVALLLVANIVNIGADIAAMGDAARLVLGGSAHLYAAGFGVLSVLLQVFVPYTRYVRVLKWLTMALLAYIGTAFVIDVPWKHLLSRELLPPYMPWRPEYITTLVAVFGTTISPYLFFWQTSQEVEDLHADPHAHALKGAPREARADFARIQLDTYLGMGLSNLVAFFIMLTAAVTLHAHGISDIQSSAQAAEALRPIAGNFAFVLFAVGIVGTGLLAVPVLAGSAAYAVAGTFHWRNSLELPARKAPYFYTIIAAATLLGVAMVFMPLNPIKALYWSAVVNGVISVPVMVIMMLLASNPAVMGRLTIPRRLKLLGWICTVVMAAAIVAMVVV
jgi:NRAMP (natural resistance-associated macrophage protein)-like metal ion transporter